jgi:hypothetical protein
MRDLSIMFVILNGKKTCTFSELRKHVYDSSRFGLLPQVHLIPSLSLVIITSTHKDKKTKAPSVSAYWDVWMRN